MSRESNGHTFEQASTMKMSCNHLIKELQDILSPADQSESSLVYAMNCQKYEVAYSEDIGSLSLDTSKTA